jgi:hypothetical protein
MLGALGTYVVLNPNLVPTAWGWRLSFILGGLLGLFTLVRDRFFEIRKWKGADMESAVNFFHLGMSVSAYRSIRVPRVGSTSWALLELAKPLFRKGHDNAAPDFRAPSLSRPFRAVASYSTCLGLCPRLS